MSLETPFVKKARPARPTPARRAAQKLPEALSRQIARFALPVRAELRRLVRSTPRASELIEVFPAVAYALAIRHGGDAAADAGRRLVAEGAPLRAVAGALGLPMWLRRLPPEAFTTDLCDLPHEEAFARRVPARLPARAAEAADWLEAIRFASRAADTDFALWIARHRLHNRASVHCERLVLLASYAWHSTNPAHPASDLVWARWRPEMAPDTAICAAKSWFNRVLLCVRMPPGRALDPWLAPGAADGLAFVPLCDSDSVLREARAMRNCADQYAMPLINGRCRLFSVRRGEQHVATLEVIAHSREQGVLTIGQLKGPGNAPAPLDIWQAALRWLAAQPRLLQMPPIAPQPPVDALAWHDLLAPYRRQRGGAPWLPVVPEAAALADIEAGLAGLARDANIRSWLFL